MKPAHHPPALSWQRLILAPAPMSADLTTNCVSVRTVSILNHRTSHLVEASDLHHRHHVHPVARNRPSSAAVAHSCGASSC